MNTTYKSLLLVSILTFAFANILSAQQIDETTASTMIAVKEGPRTGNNYTAATLPGSNSNVTEHQKASKSFSILFPNFTGQQWTETNDALYVSFINDRHKTRASFSKNGRLNYAIADYELEQLPQVLQQYIKKEYPDYTVFNAIKITAYNATAYQLILENNLEFITLKSTIDGIEQTAHQSK
jgi:hypothetical protein